MASIESFSAEGQDPGEKPFVAAMAFPNKEDAFPNLANRIALAARREPSGKVGEGGGAPRLTAPL